MSHRYPPGARASANQVKDLAEALAGRGHQIHVLTKMPTEYLPTAGERPLDPPRMREVVGGVDIFRVRGLSSLHQVIAVRAIEHIVLGLVFAKAVRQLPRPDVVVVLSPPMPVALFAAVYSWWTRVPYVLNLHDLYPQTAIELGMLKNSALIWVMRKMENAMYACASQIVVPHPGSVKYLTEEKKIPAEQVHRVPNWTDVKSHLPGMRHNAYRKVHSPSRRFVVSYAGLMGFAQDLTTIIECARTLQHRRDCIFLLIGDGVYAQQWQDRAEGLDNVKFLPPVAEEQYYEALRASDVCLVPLTGTLASPAIPGKIQSIMSVARPLVAIVPLTGDAANFVRVSQCGFVVAPDDVTGLGARIEELLDNPHLADELGTNGRVYTEKHCSLESAAVAFERVLDNAVTQH